jgi:raffinose/stachyose/melibiose transport system substrate-binding protein
MKRLIALLLTLVMATGVTGMLSGCQTWPEPGRVYYINCVPEANEAWQKLAAAYSDIHGIEVTVRTINSDDYMSVLASELKSENAPTGFQFQSAQEIGVLREYCLDLTGSAVLGQMTTGDFNLADTNGAVRAIGYSYEAFGLIVNKELLEQADYKLEDIQDFASLKAVAEDIHSRADQLGFDAFAVPDLTGISAWRFTRDLASVPVYYEQREQGTLDQKTTISGTYLENYRQIWDLLVDNSMSCATAQSATPVDTSLEELGTGKVVFCLHRASVYSDLVGEVYAMDPKQITMLPIFCGVEGEENAALCCSDKGYWAVNAKASEADRKATLDFLNWIVTSETGIRIMEEQFGGVPFKAAGKTGNGFYSASNALLAKGNYAITGWMARDDQWETELTTALTEYSASRTDENWDKVAAAFVESRS